MLIKGLVQPLPIVLFLLLVGCVGVVLHRPRIVRIGLLGVLFLTISCMPFVGRALMAGLEGKYPVVNLNQIPEKSVALVLSGGIDMPVSPRVSYELTHAADRLIYAADLYKSGKVQAIMVTGGSTYPSADVLSEGEYSIELLEKIGIPSHALLGEFQSVNTFENITFSEPLLSAMEERNILIVTSAAHMSRAIAVAEKSNLATEFNIIAAPTDYRVALNAGTLMMAIIPSAPGLNLTTMAAHEYIGWFYYKWKGYL